MSKATKITAEDVIALHPCWQEETIRTQIGKGKTPAQIAVASHVCAADRRWVLTRLLARTESGRRALVLWAAGCAQDVQHLVGEDAEGVAEAAIAAATAWAEGSGSVEDCASAAYYAATAATAAYYAAYAAYYAAYAYYAATAAYYAYYAATAATAEPGIEEKHLLDLAAALTAELESQ